MALALMILGGLLIMSYVNSVSTRGFGMRHVLGAGLPVIGGILFLIGLLSAL